MAKFPFGIFLTNILNCKRPLVYTCTIAGWEAKRLMSEGDFDYESLFPGTTWEEVHGAAWGFWITLPSILRCSLSLLSTPLSASEPQLLSLKPWFITPGSEEVRRYNLPKYLVGKQEGGDFIPMSCEMSLGLAWRDLPTPSAAGVPHPSCNRKVYRCRLRRGRMCVCVCVFILI